MRYVKPLTIGLLSTACVTAVSLNSTAYAASEQHGNVERAVASYQAMQKYYYQPQSSLYSNTYPPRGNQYSYNWEFGQALSATIDMSTLPKVGGQYVGAVQSRLNGLRAYWDSQSTPPGYDSYVLSPYGNGGDKFYDDNDWIGLDLMHLYELNKNPALLKRAEQIFALEEHGWDTNPSHPDPGGVYWTQASWSQDRNTVSNAPAAELGLYLYQVTGDESYFDWAKKMYDWVNTYMLAPNGLYYDHVDLQGNLNKVEWSYNQGTMIGASVLFYEITGQRSYLTRAENIAKASLNYYETNNRLYQQDPIFNAIYFENLLVLQAVHHDPKYRQAMQAYADNVWQNDRDTATNIFTFGSTSPVDLLNQAAMVQIYATLASQKAWPLFKPLNLSHAKIR